MGIVFAPVMAQSLAMRVIVSLICVSLLAGCLPVRTFYAEGASFAALERDNTRCDVAALRDAPVATQVHQAPPRFVRRRSCNAAGHCKYHGGYWVPGDVYTVDVNADLRRRVKNQCMADRGYRPVEIPACPSGVANAAPAGPSSTLPRLSENSCAIRTEGGGFRIVNQG